MRRQIYNYFFLLLLLVVLVGIAKVLAPFLGALLAALLCAMTFYPAHEALRRWIPRYPSLRAALSDTLVLIFFVAPLSLLVWAVLQESNTLIAVMKQGSVTVTQWRQGNVFESAPWMEHVRFFLSRAFGIRRAQFQETVIGWMDAALEHLSLTGTFLAANALFLLFDLLIMLFALFFMFRDGPRIWHHVQSLLPIRREHQDELALRIHDALIQISRGLFLTSLIQGVAATVGYWLVGAEAAVLLGALTAVMGLFPVVGTFGIWGPTVLFFLIKGLYTKGLFLFLWGALVVIGLVDTLIRPYLLGKKMELPLFALFFALLGGAEVWGFKGLILGPLLFAIAPVLLDIYRNHYLNRSPDAVS